MGQGIAIVGLGIDAGGTATRWALARGSEGVLAEGEVGGIGGHLAQTVAGREALMRELQPLAAAIDAAGHGRPARLWAGITGFDPSAGPLLPALFGQSLGLRAEQMMVTSDIELACRVCFEPGTGHLVFSGTGSFGAHLDAAGGLHRVGGRGPLIGDEGSGHWIAQQALAALWRMEDEGPGRAARTPLGQALFATLGGTDWNTTRSFIAAAGRGAIGRLAMSVAAAADEDPLAGDILDRAGRELARLASLLLRAHGHKPVAVAGRAASLHPRIMRSLQAALPEGVDCRQFEPDLHRGAALRAAGVA